MNPSIFPPLTSTRRAALVVRTAAVDVGRVVVGLLASAGRDRHAHRRHAVLHGDAVGARVGAEVAVEGAVLLLDDDDVLDLVDAGRDRRSDPSARRSPFRREAAGWEGELLQALSASARTATLPETIAPAPPVADGICSSCHECLPFDEAERWSAPARRCHPRRAVGGVEVAVVAAVVDPAVCERRGQNAPDGDEGLA